MADKKELQITFDLKTIDHLGVKLYSQIPAMVSELLSNSWDADSPTVDIYLNDIENKEIIIEDRGAGMTFDELNDSFLKIGRNRRSETSVDKTPKGRPILGKKGLGKLSVFGIGKKITVTTVKNNIKNSFTMNYDDLKKSESGMYKPDIIIREEPTDESYGTKIEITEIKRQSDFNPNYLATSLSKRFNIFDEEFVVNIYHNNNESVRVTNALYDEESAEFIWSIPSDFEDSKLSGDEKEFLISNGIQGQIFTSEKPLPAPNQGITLLARGKLVQERNPFNDRANDHFFSYMSGYIEIDFIDSDAHLDFVSTNRKELAWDLDDNGDLSKLKSLLQSIVKICSNEWKNKRIEKKKEEIMKEFSIDVPEWLDSLNEAEKPLATKLAESILQNDAITHEQATQYIGDIRSMFQFESFRNFTQKLDTLQLLENENAIKLLNDWQLIESKELAKVAEGRIATINQFEKYIAENASETRVIQKFLEKFPWILDPKMTSFRREVTYYTLLKETFPDDNLPPSNRRIDFLCSDNSGIIHVIELKRPRIKITLKEIKQIISYKNFIEKKIRGNEKVIGYLISDHMEFDDDDRDMIESLEKDGKIFVKSYSSLLKEARSYHQEFINKYEELQEKKKSN